MIIADNNAIMPSMEYFDCSATTKPSEETMKIVNHYATDFYNPSALYLPANKIKEDIENARQMLARYFNAPNGSKFLFTPSATISNSMVLRTQIVRKDKKYLISAGEHSSVYNTAKALQAEGYNIVFIPLLKSGHINTDALYASLDDSVAFVSIIHTSNETGAINDISAIAHELHRRNPRIIVHSDGVQSANKINVDLQNLDVDYYTISGHKINCMRGISALYVRYFNKQRPYIVGGGQEFNLIAGTENVAGMVSIAHALKTPQLEKSMLVRKAILDELKQVDDKIVFDGENYCPNIIMVCFANVRGETIVHMMCDKGYLVGTGSACNSKDKTNRVLGEIGVSQKYSLGAVRISFDADMSEKTAREMAQALVACVNEYRGKI